MDEEDFRKKVDKCKKTLVYFLENHYVLQSNISVNDQFANRLSQNRNHKNTEHYVTFLSIDDTFWPKLNNIAEQALLELVEQQKIFSGLTGKFYLHIGGTGLFDETDAKIDNDKTKYFLTIPVANKKL